MNPLTPSQAEFIETVLALRPQIAAFDCDGTLWSGDAGEGFFSWEMQAGLVGEEIAAAMRQRYAEYRSGRVAEEVMCGEMVSMHAGLREDAVQQACDRWFPQAIGPCIFPEMRELVQRLRASGCDVWAVSSSSQWVIRAGMKSFGIPPDRILAAQVEVDDIAGSRIITDRLLRVPSGPAKPAALRSVLSTPPDCAFGNAIWDREMLAMSRHPFAINPNDNLKQLAVANGWPVYQPAQPT
jgi:phosphoserine phosphatase